MIHVAALQSTAMARDGKVMWSVGLPDSAARNQLQDGGCLAFGDDPPGADVMTPSRDLELGVSYNVFMNTDLLKNGRSENRRYSGDFCLSRRSDGKVRVHDLWFGDRTTVSPQDACFGLYRQH